MLILNSKFKSFVLLKILKEVENFKRIQFNDDCNICGLHGKFDIICSIFPKYIKSRIIHEYPTDPFIINIGRTLGHQSLLNINGKLIKEYSYINPYNGRDWTIATSLRRELETKISADLIINCEGKIICDDVEAIYPGESKYLGRNLRNIPPNKFPYLVEKKNGLYNFITVGKGGKLKFLLEKDVFGLTAFSNNIAKVQPNSYSDTEYLIDKEGNILKIL